MKSIKWNDIISDLVILLVSVFFLKESDILFVSEKSGSLSFLIIFIGIILTAPWYMGRLFRKFDLYENKPLKKIVKWVVALIMLALISYLAIISTDIIHHYAWDDKNAQMILMYGMFTIVLAPLMILAGYSKKPGASIAIFLIILSLAFIVYYTHLFDRETIAGDLGFFIILGLFFGGVISAFIVVIPFMMINEKLKKKNKTHHITNIQAYISPIIVLLFLTAWNEITLEYNHEYIYEGGINHGAALLSMTLSGIIPFRLLMAIVPPFNLSSFISGTIMMIVLYSTII